MPNLDAYIDAGIILKSQSLAKYTAARLGGNADLIYVARQGIEELAEIVLTAWQMNLPVTMLGGGANVLVSDKGVRGLVIINRNSKIEFGDWHDGRNVSATSGTNLLRLARDVANHGLAGMEWAVGVPGTLGGAIVNNAGAHGTNMASSIADVVVLDAKEGAQLYTRDDMEFAYRHSLLKAREDRRFLVLQANLILQPDDQTAIQNRMDDYNVYRKRTQPPGASLGSIFKNPEGDYAGRLIEESGLKGFQIGQAQVSPVHANFLVNLGDASASDYFALINHVCEVVYERFNITLEMEIEALGDWD